MKKGITTVSVFIMVAIIVFLLGTITVSTYSTIQNAKKIAFALEISSIQEEVDRYVKEYGNDTLPISDNVYTLDLSDVTGSDNVQQFTEETKNANNEIILYEIDLSTLGIDYTEYGNKDNEKDVYVVSKETNNVYYLAGLKAGDKTYYTLTQDLIDIKDRKEKEKTVTESTAPVITAGDIISKTLDDGTKETYLSNIKVIGENIKIVKYEIGKISEDIAKDYFKSNGYTITGDRIKLKEKDSVTLYAENNKGQYMVLHCEDYIDSIIPDGFVLSIYDGETEIDEGMVIYQTNSLEGISHETAMESYNQFVWVPVDDITKFRRTTTYNGTITSPDTKYTEPFSRTTPDGVTLSLTNDLTGEWTEYLVMHQSVRENKGFYIGRYEAGTTSERINYNDNRTTGVVVRKNKPVYNLVAWGQSMTDVAGDVLYSSLGYGTKYNYGKGAVELSRNMYKGSSSVVSTLCYGVQWDAALQFIYKTDPEYPTNSSNKGNYSTSLKKTGYYAINNIYDMAGNILEKTMEAESTNYRVSRGGSWGRRWDLHASFVS